MTPITVKMVQIKAHKTLLEYAEVDASGEPVRKPRVSPIYVRRGEYDAAAYILTLTPTEV